MPNPFIKTGQTKTSKEPPVLVQEETDVPSGVIPYRGVETHGVPLDKGSPFDVDANEADYGTTVAVPIEPVPEEPDPVPVRIVGEGGPNDLRIWETESGIVVDKAFRSGSQCTMILAREESRMNLRLINTDDTNTLYVAPIPFAMSSSAFPVLPGKEFTLPTAVTEVYALADGGDVSWSAYYEKSVKRQ